MKRERVRPTRQIISEHDASDCPQIGTDLSAETDGAVIAGANVWHANMYAIDISSPLTTLWPPSIRSH